MGKIKIGIGVILVIFALIMTKRSDVFVLYGVCAVLHEAGHLAAARRRGIKIKEIRLDVSGIRICTEEGAGSYIDEFVLCMSGPLVNVIIIAVGAGIFLQKNMDASAVASAIEAFAQCRSGSYYGALGFFMICSVIQGGLNLLPIKTFDGGRMLFCLCAMAFGSRTAERVIGITSALCMLAIWMAALYLMIRVDAGLSIYTFAACVFLGTLRDKELIE